MSNTSSVSFTVDETKKIKGMGILLMIFHHMFGSMADFSAHGLQLFFVRPDTLELIGRSCRICVYLFILLSAYGLSVQYRKTRKKKESSLIFVLVRWIKLLSPYWFTLVILWLAYLFVFSRDIVLLYGENYIAHMIQDFFAVTDILGNADWMLITVFWFMNFSMLLGIIFPVVYLICDKLGWILLPLTMVVYNFLPSILGSNYSGDYNWYIYAVEIGILLCKYDLLNRMSQIWDNIPMYGKVLLGGGLLISSLLVPYLTFLKLQTNIFGVYLLLQTLGALCCLVGTFLVFRGKVCKKILTFMGNYSGDMYLLHLLLIAEIEFIYCTDLLLVQYLICVTLSLALAILLAILKKYSGYNKLFEMICSKLQEQGKNRENQK